MYLNFTEIGTNLTVTEEPVTVDNSQTGRDREADAAKGDIEADAGIRTSTDHHSRDIRKRSGIYRHAERINETRIDLFLHGDPGAR